MQLYFFLFLFRRFACDETGRRVQSVRLVTAVVQRASLPVAGPGQGATRFFIDATEWAGGGDGRRWH